MRSWMIPVAVASAFVATSFAQSTEPASFEVVSIKRVAEVRRGGEFRPWHIGSAVMSNIRITGFVREASPVKVRDVVGLPGWADTDRFDVTVKPPAGATEEQRRVMWGAMFA